MQVLDDCQDKAQLASTLPPFKVQLPAVSELLCWELQVLSWARTRTACCPPCCSSAQHQPAATRLRTAHLGVSCLTGKLFCGSSVCAVHFRLHLCSRLRTAFPVTLWLCLECMPNLRTLCMTARCLSNVPAPVRWQPCPANCHAVWSTGACNAASAPSAWRMAACCCRSMWSALTAPGAQGPRGALCRKGAWGHTRCIAQATISSVHSKDGCVLNGGTSTPRKHLPCQF